MRKRNQREQPNSSAEKALDTHEKLSILKTVEVQVDTFSMIG
jgi:hypothetical protein